VRRLGKCWTSPKKRGVRVSKSAGSREQRGAGGQQKRFGGGRVRITSCRVPRRGLVREEEQNTSCRKEGEGLDAGGGAV